MVTAKTFGDLRPVLMEKVKKGIKTPSYLIQDKEQVIFVVSSGKNGMEFNKTVGYFSSFPGMTSYQCLYGQGIFVMQRNDTFGEAKEFKVVILNPGKQVLVSAGWGMCIVNSGISVLVVLRNSMLDADYEDIKPVTQKRGFAYYVIEKKGEISFERNPNYQVYPQITTE